MAKRNELPTLNGVLAFAAAVTLLVLVDREKPSPLTPWGTELIVTQPTGVRHSVRRSHQVLSSDSAESGQWKRRKSSSDLRDLDYRRPPSAPRETRPLVPSPPAPKAYLPPGQLAFHAVSIRSAADEF